MRPITQLAAAAALVVIAAQAHAQSLVPPEVVRLENVLVEGDMKRVYVGNANNHYLLFCNLKAAGCITPEEDKNYLLFDSETRWKVQGAKDVLTLEGIQGWTVTYRESKNIGLIPEDPTTNSGLGMFIFDETGGGYERDIVTQDGPIVYGSDLSDEDRAKAWKQFFTMMVEAAAKQQGTDALSTKLAPRCKPDENFCTRALDANLVGIGGIQEPRRVLVLIAIDVHDKTKQLSRTVCTSPSKGTVICRDWDTGKLMSTEHLAETSKN